MHIYSGVDLVVCGAGQHFSGGLVDGVSGQSGAVESASGCAVQTAAAPHVREADLGLGGAHRADACLAGMDDGVGFGASG